MLETVLLYLGGVLLVGGIVLPITPLAPYAAYVFLIGSLLYGLMQWRQCYDGDDLVVKRLRRILLLSDVLFVASAVLLLMEAKYFGLYLPGAWKIVMLIAAVQQIYAVFRLSSALPHREA